MRKFWFLVACAMLGAACGSVTRSEANYAAIVAGCKASLDIERDAGEAGAENKTAEGCRAALDSWERAK